MVVVPAPIPFAPGNNHESENINLIGRPTNMLLKKIARLTIDPDY